MTTPDRLEQVLTELEALEQETSAYSIEGYSAYKDLKYLLIQHWPLLRAKLRAALEMEKTLQAVYDRINYREHAFGEPEVDTGIYLKSLHDWLDEGGAALAAWQQAGEE